MAAPTELPATPEKLFKFTSENAKLLGTYLNKILDSSNSHNENFRCKMDAIDQAYARYLTAKDRGDLTTANRYGNVACRTGMSPVVSPIVISQVQSMVAFWSEVYLSGYPIFPVVSTPDLRNEAEALEGIMQDHLNMSESIPELQLLFNSGARYNLMAWDLDWTPLTAYNPTKTLTDIAPNANTLAMDYKHINSIKCLNLRNAHWDRTVNISKVDSIGAYAGYTEIYNRIQLKALLNYLSNEKKLTSNSVVNEAMESSFQDSDWHEDPIIGDYSTNEASNSNNWDSFGGFVDSLPAGLRQVPSNSTGVYAVHKFYLRILPSDFMLQVPNKNHVQVWKCIRVNRGPIISMEPFIGPYDRFGMGLSLAIEDGMQLQTQSYGEMAMPLQEAVTRLFNIKFQASSRALQDRALYNPEMIRAADINSPFMGSKIPVVPSSLMNNGMDNAYKQIPFDARGTEGAMQDAMIITDWQKELSGQNNASRGQFTKGNRTQGEFNEVMGNSENRLRLSALVIEHRVFAKLKAGMKLNILQFGQDTEIISPRTGTPLQVSIEKLQKVNLQFEVADGYTPKSKMANTDSLIAIMNMISQSAPLQQTMGSQLPGLMAHIASLLGIRGFDLYARTAVDEYAKNMELQLQIQSLMQQLLQQQSQATGQPPEQAAPVEGVPANG